VKKLQWLRGCRGCVHPRNTHIRLFGWHRPCLVCPCTHYRAEWADPLLMAGAGAALGIVNGVVAIVFALLGGRLNLAEQLVWISATIMWASAVLLLIRTNRKLRRLLTRVLSRDASRVLLRDDES